MPWSGGSFSRTDGTRNGATVWTQAKAASVKVRADDHDTHDQDIADGINACLNGDGSNSPSGDFDWNAQDLTNVGVLTVGSGAAATPALAFETDSTTGFYRIAASTMGLSLGGTEKLRVSATELRLSGDQFLGDSSGNEFLKFSKTASAVNEITIANAATGNKPAVSATGGDTNVGLELTPKGTGDFTVGGVSLLPSETTWTPAITADGTAGTPSYDSRPATYTKIGNRVWFECFIDLANWTGTPSGNVSITGLPFSALSLTALLIPVSVARIAGFNLSAGYTQVVAEISNAASSIRLFEAGDNVASQQIQASAVSTTATIALSGSYRVA